MKTASNNYEGQTNLRNETVIVRFIPRLTQYSDKNEVLYGGMGENCSRVLTVPTNSAGNYIGVLTSDEQKEFEGILGVNLSSSAIKDNYWDTFHVELDKKDKYLDLSNVNDYITWKVLLSNSSLIAPSKEIYDNSPLPTYEYYITSSNESDDLKSRKREMKWFCLNEIQKLKTNSLKLKTVFEMLNKGIFVTDSVSPEFILNKLDEMLERDPKQIFMVLNDKTLDTRLFINNCINKKLISRIGDFYYIVMNKSKVNMSNEDKEPTILEAVRYLQDPKNNKIKIELEAMLQRFKDDEKKLDVETSKKI